MPSKQAHGPAFPVVRPQAVLLIGAGPSVVAWVRACKAHTGVPVYTFSPPASVAKVQALGDDSRGLAVARVVPYPWQGVTPQTLTQAMERLGPLDRGGYAMNFSPATRHGSSCVDITVVGPGGRTEAAGTAATCCFKPDFKKYRPVVSKFIELFAI